MTVRPRRGGPSSRSSSEDTSPSSFSSSLWATAAHHHAHSQAHPTTTTTTNGGSISLFVDDLTESMSYATNNKYVNEDTEVSSWHEEAHWMSFRLAVQQFASLKLILSTTTDDPSVAYIATKNDNDDDDHTIQEQDINFSNNNDERNMGVSSTRKKSDSILSDLAETKMRLALAQAERDELEFTLMQQQSPKATNNHLNTVRL